MAQAYKMLSYRKGLYCIKNLKCTSFVRTFSSDENTRKSAQIDVKTVSDNFSKYYGLSDTNEFLNLLTLDPPIVHDYDRHVRDLILSNDFDNLAIDLQNSSSVEQVFETLFNKNQNWKHRHICLAIYTLYKLQNVYNNSYLHNLSKSDIVNSPQYMLDSYINSLKSHPDFQRLIIETENYTDCFNFDEATFCMHYLKKMGVGLDNRIQRLLLNICNNALDDEPQVSSQTIAYFSHVIQPVNYSGYFMTARAILPYALKYLESCTTLKDLEYVTLTLRNIHIFVSAQVLELYKQKVIGLIENKPIAAIDIHILLKIIHLLNMPHWSNGNLHLIKSLCSFTKSHIHKMGVPELVELSKVVNYHLEPRYIIEGINRRSRELLKELQDDDRVNAVINAPHLLFCQIIALKPNQQRSVENLMFELLSDCNPSSLGILYKILRHLKSSNTALRDKFWQKVLEVSSSLQNIEPDFIIRMCHKYMYFDHYLGNKYKHLNFENYITTLLVSFMERNVEEMIPKKYARMASFIIASCHVSTVNHDILIFLEKVAKKLESISDQLDIYDCYELSKALVISSTFNHSKYIPQEFQYIYHRIDLILSKCSQSHSLLNLNMLDDVNIIMRTYINRQSNFDSAICRNIIIQYCDAHGNMSSRNSRDAILNMMSLNTVIPELIEEMLKYAVNFHNDMMGETIHMFLMFCYRSGYTPTVDGFCQVAKDVINRDREQINGLMLIVSGLALSFFDSPSEDLFGYVFSLKFMEMIEDEVSNYYNKRGYPIRIRRALMDLNRTVCIEYPQYQIPWFHEKYLQEVISQTPVKKTAMHSSIMDTLISISRNKDAVKHSHFAPYGLHVDFLLHIGKNGDLKSIKKTDDTDFDKLAVLILEPSMCSKLLVSKESKQFESISNGSYLMKKRHLEMLGYKVVEVSRALWNSMHMAEPGAKSSFLKSKIWANA